MQCDIALMDYRLKILYHVLLSDSLFNLFFFGSGLTLSYVVMQSLIYLCRAQILSISVGDLLICICDVAVGVNLKEKWKC